MWYSEFHILELLSREDKERRVRYTTITMCKMKIHTTFECDVTTIKRNLSVNIKKS